MSFRNDHDAAISRIAALEHELAEAREQAREQAERERGRIAMLEREIAELRRGEPPPPRRARTPSTPPVAQAPLPQPFDEAPRQGPAVSRGALLAMIMFAGALVGGLMWFVLLSGDAEKPPEVDACELRSEPPYADVIGIRAGNEIMLGVAPVERSFDGWREYSRIVLRLPGHDDVIVEPPSSVTTCPSGAIGLTRR